MESLGTTPSPRTRKERVYDLSLYQTWMRDLLGRVVTDSDDDCDPLTFKRRNGTRKFHLLQTLR